MMDALEEFPHFACKQNTEKNSITHMSMLCHKILSKFNESQGPATKFSEKIFLTSRNIKRYKKTEHKKRQLNPWTNFEEEQNASQSWFLKTC